MRWKSRSSVCFIHLNAFNFLKELYLLSKQHSENLCGFYPFYIIPCSDLFPPLTRGHGTKDLKPCTSLLLRLLYSLDINTTVIITGDWMENLPVTWVNRCKCALFFCPSVYMYFCNTLNVFVNKVVDFLPGFVLFPFRWENDLFHFALLLKFPSPIADQPFW